ncbi:YncE family protein [Amycolatopsis jejuensis]|uniref:YncE family protein n=1 Tax=Amycolatopsis jejuensis TaxID=330084 RepID=UPI000691BEA9|nr:YncE family protein [Amycolatopsis jejuensis]
MQAKSARRMILGAAAAAVLVLPGAVATADPNPVAQLRSFGAYEGTVNGVPTPFDGQIHNNTLAISPDQRLAVAAKSQSGTLVVIDLHTGRKITEIGGYVSPRNILFAPDGHSFTVSDSTLGVLDRLSTWTFRLEKRLPLGAGVFGTAQTSDGKRLYANNQASGTVTVVDLKASRPLTVITGFSQPRQGVKLSPAGDKVYVTNYEGNRITVVDTATDKPIGNIGPFNEVRGLSVSHDGTRLYVAGSGDNTVSIVDTATRAIVQKVTVGEKPYGAALSPDEKVLFSGNLAGNSLTAVDPATGTVLGTVTGLKGPRQAISFSADSTTAWVLNEDLTVAEVDVQARQVKRVLG